VTTFNSEQDKLGGNDLLTEKQREWIDLKLLVLRAAPLKKMQSPNNRLSRSAFLLVQHPIFDRFILLSILLNCIFLLMKWYQQSA
jgi:hypothetical protein